MPHVSDIRAMSPDHDRHDLMLVAALAAGDLSGTDRDHALDLIRTCASCAELRDDLVTIATATAAVPPPVTARPRDFQLTPGDAARLRPAGWRRLADAVGGIPAAFSRPLGVGLATLGLVGLIVGNAPAIGLGGAAASPAAAASAGSALDRTNAGAGDQQRAAAAAASAAASAAFAPEGNPAGPSPSSAAASSAAGGYPSSMGNGGQPAASTDAAFGGGLASGGPPSSQRLEVVAASGGPKIATDQVAGRDGATGSPSADPLRPLNLLFALAVLGGLAILVLDRVRRRAAA